MAVSFGCPLVGTLSELNDKVLKVGQRAYATDGIGTKWKTGDGIQTFSALNWDKNEGGDSDNSTSSRIEDGEGDYSIQQKTNTEYWKAENPEVQKVISSQENSGIKLNEGNISVGAFGDNSSMFNGKSQTVGGRSHAEGSKNIALESNSHAEGNNTFAAGQHSHSEGNTTSALGNASHAEGFGGIAKGDYSHAEGNQTVAEGEGSHAEGEATQALNKRSHAEGLETIAKGDNAHAEGGHTVAAGDCQHVQGKYNKELGDEYAHIVGNGEVNKPSNAHTLKWNGDAWYAGKITFGENEAEVESIENKSTIIDDNADDTKYPTTKAVKTFVESKIGSGGNVNLDNYYTKEETDAKISSVYKYCGSVDSVSELPSNVAIGDTYNILNTSTVENYFANVNWEGKIVEPGLPLLNVFDELGNNIDDKFRNGNMVTTDTDLKIFFVEYDEHYKSWATNTTLIEDISLTTFKIDSLSCDAGDNLAWTGFTWDNLGGTVDLSNYYTNEEVNTRLNEKQNIDNMLQFVSNDLSDLDYAYPSVSAVVDYVKREISSLYKYCGSVSDLNDLPTLTIGGDIGYTYNIINSSSRSFTYEKSLGGVFDEGLLIITDEKGNNISSLFPRGSIIMCDNGDKISLETLTDNKWRTNPSYEIRGINILQYSQPTINCDSGDNVVWTGYSWDILSGTIDLSNYYTKQEVDNQLGSIEEATAAIIALQNSYIGGETV